MEPITFVLAAVGVAAGFGVSTRINRRQIGTAKDKASKELTRAKKEAAETIKKAQEDAALRVDEARRDEQKRRAELKEIEQRLLGREETLDKKIDELDKRGERLRKAAEKLMAMTERDIKNDLTGLVKKLQNEAKDEAEEQAASLLITTMERMASEVTAERTVSAVKLEDEEMKGRIIGKEGRNIQALQRATGVDILVDETPGMIVLSSFDPVRREIARQAMEMLLKDGRIHPGRIEEVVEKAQALVQKEVVRAGEDAAREVGIVGVPKEILQLLGELKYRTSYGQNVLRHSIEIAHLAGVLAEELGANAKIAKYAAL